MKSPKDQWIIQIEITNACVHNCSNCTRFCGHHKKPFFMHFDTFRRAVDSLEGHVGIIGIMGGEPTLHPEFERFVEYLEERIPVHEKARLGEFVYPQRDFNRARDYAEIARTATHHYATGPRDIIRGAGLWSSMNRSYKKYFELCQDHFPYQCLNDHNNVMHHQPVMITRGELGIDDATFKRLRDKCWIQQLWSSSITPKGAFFCEIAASMDMLLDGPGGWPIEPGWWKREEEDFGGQLAWCEVCGIALETFSRDAREETDDASPLWMEKLKSIDSPKLKKGRVNAVKISGGVIDKDSTPAGKAITFDSGAEAYADSHDTKFSAEKSVLYPEGFEGVIVADEDTPAGTLENLAVTYADMFDKVSVVYAKEHFGRAFNRILAEADPDKYLIVVTANVLLNQKNIAGLGECIINPGTLHYIDFSAKSSPAAGPGQGGREGSPPERGNGYFDNYDTLDNGFAALLNKKALSLRNIGFDRVANIRAFDEIVKLWEPAKVVRFESGMEYRPKPYPKKGEAEKRASLVTRGFRHLKRHGFRSTARMFCKKLAARLRRRFARPAPHKDTQ